MSINENDIKIKNHNNKLDKERSSRKNSFSNPDELANRQSSAAFTSKLQLKFCMGGPQTETCDSMSIKFQQLLNTDLRILD